MSKNEQQVMATSDFNLQKLSTKDLSEHVSASIQVGSNIAVFGRRGTGKTEIAKYEVSRAGLKEIYLNLSVLERVDMGGYPDVMNSHRENRFVDFLLPSFYQAMIDGDDEVVAILDEVDKADTSLWAPLLEFTQFHSINGKKLPNLRAIIMTGNLISEGGFRPSLPLLDRTEKYLVEADSQSWLEWAGKRGKIHPSITAYISDHPKELFGSIDPDDRYADPSPRGWTRASELLFKGESKGWNTSLLNTKVSGCVGKGSGLKYQNYYDHYQQLLPMIEDIYRGKNVSSTYNGLEPTKKIVACMITCARLANILDQAHAKGEESPVAIKHVGKFIQKASFENVLVAVRSQIQVERLIQWSLDDHPDWKNILDSICQSVDGN